MKLIIYLTLSVCLNASTSRILTYNLLNYEDEDSRENDYISIVGDINGKRRTYIGNAGVALYLSESFVIRGAVLDVGNHKEERDVIVGASFSRFL